MDGGTVLGLTVEIQGRNSSSTSSRARELSQPPQAGATPNRGPTRQQAQELSQPPQAGATPNREP
jgi:hypothetical protein